METQGTADDGLFPVSYTHLDVYKRQVYESLIDGNVWAPDAYPAGWKIVE